MWQRYIDYHINFIRFIAIFVLRFNYWLKQILYISPLLWFMKASCHCIQCIGEFALTFCGLLGISYYLVLCFADKALNIAA